MRKGRSMPAVWYHFTESNVLEPACEAAQGSRFYMA